jgi:hypothetical protein
MSLVDMRHILFVGTQFGGQDAVATQLVLGSISQQCCVRLAASKQACALDIWRKFIHNNAR